MGQFWKSDICDMYHTFPKLSLLNHQHIFVARGEYTGTHSAGQQTKIIQGTDINELFLSIVKGLLVALNLCIARGRIQTWLV